MVENFVQIRKHGIFLRFFFFCIFFFFYRGGGGGRAGEGWGREIEPGIICHADISRRELTSGARSQESLTKHHAKLGSWGPARCPLPYPAYPHPKVPS